MKLRQTLLTLICCGLAPAAWAYKVTVTEVVSLGGTSSETLTTSVRETGTAYETTAAPVRMGYIFTGWRVAGNVTLDARDVFGRARKTAAYEITGKTDVVLTAEYLADNVDTDKDGLPDGWERYWYGSMTGKAMDDTDGDGYTSAQELARGSSPILADTHAAGGVFSGVSSEATLNPHGYAPYVIRSEPEGTLFATVSDHVLPGTTVTTDAYSPASTSFAYWKVNGVRQVDAFGRAKRAITFEPDVVGGTEVVAVCVTDERERLCQYYYGRIVADASDTDGDGYTFAQELARGSNPLLADAFVAGGVTSGMSELAVCRSGSVAEIVIRCDPAGTLFPAATHYLKAGESWTSESYSPKTTAFAYWTVDGVRQADATGRASKTVVLTPAGGAHVEVVAHCVEAERLRLSQYYYGRIVEDSSDTDGDGYTFAQELARGSNPLLSDAHVPGGVFSDMSSLATVDLQGLLTVTFDLGDRGERTGGGELQQRVASGESATPPEVVAAEGWRLAGWSPSVVNVTSSGTIRAVYEPVAYSISYCETRGRLSANPTSYTIEDEISFAPLADVYGWRFAGWSPAKVDRGTTGDLVVTAQWEKMRYPIRFDGGDADGYEYGTCVTQAVPKEMTLGYTNIVCLGWVGSGDVSATGVGTQVTFTVTQASSLRWLYQTNYWVSVEVSEPDGGSVVLKEAAGKPVANELWVAAGTDLMAEATANEGWRFVGWYDRSASASDAQSAVREGARSTEITVDRPRLLTAMFAKLEYAVTFDLGGCGVRTGGGALSQIVKWGEAAVAPTVRPKLGYEFVGWDVAFDDVTEDRTVTALYEQSSGGVAGSAVVVPAPETTVGGKVTWSAKGLPTGMKIATKDLADKTFGNVPAGTIYGTPTKPGTYVVRITAKGTTTETFEVAVVIGNFTDEQIPLEDVYGTYHVGAKTIVDLSDFADCTVSGLPAGLKFAAKATTDKTFGAIAAGMVYGVPTKACTNTATFTKKIGAVTHKASATFVVAGLPYWAVGTFNGRLDDGSGSATLTVAATGKISGKVVTGGKTWSFSAVGFEAVDETAEEVETLDIVAESKSGSVVQEVSLAVSAASATGSFGDLAPMTLWRNGWKDKNATDGLKPYVGLYTVQLEGDDAGYGYLSLTLDAKGNCKAAGKLPDGTAASGTLPLVWDSEADVPFAVWQLAPSAYKGGCVGGILNWDEEKKVSAEGVHWTSCAPTASGEYGAGFDRNLSAKGAWYDKLATLASYYNSLTFNADAPELDVTVKSVDYDDGGKRVTTSETTAIDASVLDCWGGLTLSLDAKGTAFVVDQGAATRPVQDRDTQEWKYEGKNDAALTFSFTKATGIFKGSFTCWYDYVSSMDNTKDPAKETVAHTSKKVSYEGVMVLGDALRGYYLWERTGSYTDEKSGKDKTYKYKESRPVRFE